MEEGGNIMYVSEEPFLCTHYHVSRMGYIRS